MPRYATYTRLGKTVKRRLLTKAEKKARAVKFRETMTQEGHFGKAAHKGSNAASAPVRRLRRGPGRGGPVITTKDDALTYLRQGQRKLVEAIRSGKLDEPDPIHTCMLLALQALNETS